MILYLPLSLLDTSPPLYLCFNANQYVDKSQCPKITRSNSKSNKIWFINWWQQREHIPWEIMECLNKRLLQGLGLFCVILERVVPDCVLSGSRSIFLTGCLNNCYLGGKRN